MQIIVEVLISLAEWYATLGPHLFHFKSLGLLAVPLDNDNVVLYGVNYPCEWNRTFCMIQHKILAFRRQTFIKPLLYIYLYICFWIIYCS